MQILKAIYSVCDNVVLQGSVSKGVMCVPECVSVECPAVCVCVMCPLASVYACVHFASWWLGGGGAGGVGLRSSF